MRKTTKPGQGDLTRTLAFILLALAAFLSGANLRIFDSLLPSVAIDFGVLPTTAAVVVTAFTFAYGIFQIVYGPLGDRIGKMRIAAIATICASAASIGSALAPTLKVLAILRFLTGMTTAAVIPMALAWIGDRSSYENRQSTLGRFVGFLLLGQVMGPAIGGILSQLFSWREVFYGFGAAFLALGVILLFEESRLRKTSPPSVSSGNVFRAYMEIIKIPWVRIVLLTTFLDGTLFFGTFAYVGAYLQQKFALSFGLTGAILAFYGIGGFLYTLSVRRLLSKIGERGFVKFAGMAILLCFLLLPWLPAWQTAIPLLTVTGFGFYMLHNTLQTKATEMVPAARGTAIALFAFFLFSGQAVGVSLSGVMIRLSSYSATFSGAGILLFLLTRWFAFRMKRKNA